jgi:small neutral amino acid transporter SnatA (MarC family)
VSTDILPLAITMMAGPQIMSAIVFVTSERGVKNSTAFVLGVLLATTIGVAALRGLLSLLGDNVSCHWATLPIAAPQATSSSTRSSHC